MKRTEKEQKELYRAWLAGQFKHKPITKHPVTVMTVAFARALEGRQGDTRIRAAQK